MRTYMIHQGFGQLMRNNGVSGLGRRLARFGPVVLLSVNLYGQLPVIWDANGHYYQRVDQPGITWSAAKAAAASAVYAGLPGHLATITSVEENRFLTEHAMLGGGIGILINLHWIGGYQPPGSDEPAGGWTWVTGEPFQFNNWATGGNYYEPNNAPPGENCIIFNHSYNANGKHWNDAPDVFSPSAGYVIEYEGSVPNAPPMIVQSLQPQTTAVGMSMELSVAVVGSEPMAYEWWFNDTTRLTDGGRISGSKSRRLQIVNCQLSDAGVYSVRVTNPYGAASSQAALWVLLSPNPPQITSSLTATGLLGAPFSYQITASNDPLGFGAQGFPGPCTVDTTTGWIQGTPYSPGDYEITLSASNAFGTSWATLRLTVQNPPQIMSPATFQGKYLGETAVFQVQVYGTSPLAYQWSWNGTPLVDDGRISGATSNRLQITNCKLSDEGIYSVVVSNPGGQASSAAPLWILQSPDAPRITSSLTVTGMFGMDFVYQTTATGRQPISYGAAYLPPMLTIDPITGLISGLPWFNDTTEVDLYASNTVGTNTATLTVIVQQPPVILMPPMDQERYCMDMVYFQVMANGTPPLAYQWMFNGTNLSDGGRIYGSTSNVLVISNCKVQDAGSYAVVVTNLYGQATSPAANLKVKKIMPMLIWPPPAPIMYGTPLSSNQLNAVANMPGTFVYTPPAGTVLDVPTYLLRTVFTPLDTTNFATVSIRAMLYVSPAPLLIQADNQTRIYGAPNPLFTATVTGLKKQDPIYALCSCSAGQFSPVGTYPILAQVSDPKYRLKNYSLILTNGWLTITPAPLEVTLDRPQAGYLQTVNTPIEFMGHFTETGVGPQYQAHWTFASATLPETNVLGFIQGTTVSNQFQFAEPGVYGLKLTVIDQAGTSKTADTAGNLLAHFIVHDPDGEAVTGGGWISSPPGVHQEPADKEAQNKAEFGFVAHYLPGRSVPAGNTEFHYRTGDKQMNFKSEAYDWLVVSGAWAQFKGRGTLNGESDYRFILTAIDGKKNGDADDYFRIVIWKATNGEVLYDNQPGTDNNGPLNTNAILGGGSIVIHK